MKITMVGLGYIGLPNALLLAEAGHNVYGFDINKELIQQLDEGVLPFEEPHLQELFTRVRDNFKAVTELEASDCFIIAVPTPLDKEMKMADLKAVKKATIEISRVLKKENLVILESTVPPGTSENLIVPQLSKGDTSDFFYAHCSERAIPGKTLHEMQFNDRIIGGLDQTSTDRAVELYSGFVKGKIYETDVTTAEFVKLMENTYRDVNIALANEFALISEELGIDGWKAIELANKHPRVNILKPGPGVGGHCIAVDPLFMIAKTSNAKLTQTAREINDYMPTHVVKLAKEIIKGIRNPKITILGLAYKANVDDMRESPAFKIGRIAENEGIDVVFHDPLINDFSGNEQNIHKAAEGSDCLILVTGHDLFKKVNPSELSVRNKNLIDTMGFLNIDNWESAGFKVKVLGIGVR